MYNMWIIVAIVVVVALAIACPGRRTREQSVIDTGGYSPEPDHRVSASDARKTIAATHRRLEQIGTDVTPVSTVHIDTYTSGAGTRVFMYRGIYVDAKTHAAVQIDSIVDATAFDVIDVAATENVAPVIRSDATTRGDYYRFGS